jgi:hypothetical protein
VYRIPILACLGALVLVAPLHTQPLPPFPPPAPVVVNFWYQRFLHRNADLGAAGWSAALAAGQPPELVLAAILSSPEYFINAGGTQVGFIRALYIDLTGAPPLPAQLGFWLSRSRFMSRRDIAYDLLIRFPQAWHVPPSWYSW